MAISFGKFTRPLKQRLFYLRHYNAGFSFIFLLPGALREKFGRNSFFHAVTKHLKQINLEENTEGTFLVAGEYKLRFPPYCFYEGDFFDIVYPRLGISDLLIDTLIYNNPYHESEGCYENFGTMLKPGDYVIDAGANAGMFSVVSSGGVGSSGKIFAFEPLKDMSVYLERNLKDNGCNNVIVENLALGKSNERIDFFFSPNGYNGASSVIKKGNDQLIKVEQITLDSFVEKNSLPKVNFIKADIEGSERDLLKGAEYTIKKFKPKIAIRTYHFPDDPRILYYLVKSYVPEYNVVLDKKTLYAWL